MVRLLPDWNIIQNIFGVSFQFRNGKALTKKALIKRVDKLLKRCFNSVMVRLLLTEEELKSEINKMFQFRNGKALTIIKKGRLT